MRSDRCRWVFRESDISAGVIVTVHVVSEECKTSEAERENALSELEKGERKATPGRRDHRSKREEKTRRNQINNIHKYANNRTKSAYPQKTA